MKTFSAVAVSGLVATSCFLVACTAEHAAPERLGKSLADLGKDITDIEELADGSFRVTCTDGVKEIRSEQEIILNDVCNPGGFVIRPKLPTFYFSADGTQNNCFLPAGEALRIVDKTTPMYTDKIHVGVSIPAYANIQGCSLPTGIVLAKQIDIGQSDGTTVTWGIAPVSNPPPVVAPQEFVAVEWTSDSGDYIGGGAPSLLSEANGNVTFSGNTTSGISIRFDGDTWWDVNIVPPSGGTLAVGHYANATRYPFQGTGPGLDVSGDGRGCNTLTGQFDVTSLGVDANGNVNQAEIAFEQHCEGGTAALRGHLHYNHVFAESQVSILAQTGAYIGGTGSTYLNSANPITVSGSSGYLSVNVGDGQNTWSSLAEIELAAPQGKTLQTDAYLGAQRYPFQNPLRPGLSVTADYSGCNTLTGSFRIFNYQVDDQGAVQRLDADYIQYCDGQTAATFGGIRYTAAH